MKLKKSGCVSRLTMEKEILTGKPVVRKMRIAVEQILDMLGEGFTPDQIIEEFPLLESDDIKGCILFANKLVKEETLQEATF